MDLGQILQRLFPAGHAVSVTDQVIAGEAETALGTILVLGTADAAAIDHRIALSLAARLLDTIAEHPARPILFLVDTAGQALSRHEELLCLNGSFAHLARCVDLARRQDRIEHPAHFLPVRVMDLKAMARVTKIAHQRLLELAASSPTFAPGAENYVRMGALAAIWPEPASDLLEAALGAVKAADGNDYRMIVGAARGGRQLAATTVAAVLAAP